MQFEPLESMGQHTLIQTVTKLWWDRELSDAELKIVEAMMVAAVYHEDSPSVNVTRTTNQTADTPVMAVAAGLLTIGRKHGGAVQDLARILQEQGDKSLEHIVQYYFDQGKRIPGFGHRIYKDTDPRAEKLFQIATELGLPTGHIARVREMEAIIEKIKGKKLPVNIDGSMAAILTDLGIPWHKTNAIFIWPRVAGLLSLGV